MEETRNIVRDISGLEELFSFLEGHFEVQAVSERAAFCLNLAAEEIFTNMVRHNEGGGDHIAARIEVDDESIVLQLVDVDVEPFDPNSRPDVDVNAPAAERQPGGLGIHLVKSIVDRMTYEYKNREMRVSVLKKRGG